MEIGNTRSSLYMNAHHTYYANERSDSHSETRSEDVLQKLSQKRIYSPNTYYAGIGGDRIFSDKNYAAFNVQYTESPSDYETESGGSMEYLSDARKSDVISRMQGDNRYHQATAYRKKHQKGMVFNGESSHHHRDGNRSDFIRPHRATS